jgi:signal transduction histidine kinase
MERSATRMQAMIDGLLELSRISTRGGVFQRVDLSQIVEEVISDLEPRIQASGGEVICETMPAIEADPLQIRQLLQNLISNALKFHRPETPPQVHIYTQLDLSSARGEPSLTIVVEDQGIGFDPQYTERIFQPFQRLHGRSQYEGTGMGLAICNKIVERHHGSIGAVSQPGQGTAFFITLPIKQK